MSIANETDGEFVITREFNAPRELVWKTWTDKEALAQWWGPKGLKLEVRELEVRPGGKFHYSMSTPDGIVMWGRFVYGEVLPPEKLSFTNSFSDENGGIVRAPFAATFPLEIQNTLILEENGDKTRLTLRGSPVHATEEELAFFTSMHSNMRQGFGGTFDQLEQYLQRAS